MTSSNIHNKDQTICHWIPCNIEYDGMAPVHIYFQHEEIMHDSIFAASFRGRGLLSQSPQQVNGVVMQHGKIVTNFSQLHEWEHESSPQLLHLHTSTSQIANDWMELNKVVHGELDVLEE